MDVEWAIGELTTFTELTALYRPPDPPGVAILADSRRPRGRKEEIIASAQVVEAILDRVLPGWRSELPVDESGRWQQHREAALRSVAQLQRAQEVADRLGDNAPVMSAGALHPWVWEGARSLWQSGHYREAVRAAAVKVNAGTQNKARRRDLAETALFNEMFGGAASDGKLQLPDDDGGQTAASFRRGVRAFAEGCYAAIRNPASHDEQAELAEQSALEQLAAFSVLARWVDSASLVD